MKVWELIEELEGMDPELTVLVLKPAKDKHGGHLDPYQPYSLRHVSRVERRSSDDSFRTPILALWVGREW